MSELEQNLTRARAYLKQFDGKGVLNRIGGQDSAGIGWFDTTSPVDGAHLAQVARGSHMEVMRKPVKPAQLRALMAHMLA